LHWSTSSESNSKNFEVERSDDGIAFRKIGVVAAAGNSSSNRYYTFTDPTAASENNYYRLKQVDLDDKYEYSNVILVKNNGTGNFRVINNPFRDQIEVDFGKPQTGNAGITLMDVAGKEIYYATTNLSSQARLKIYLGGKTISGGNYMLKIQTANTEFIARVVKQ